MKFIETNFNGMKLKEKVMKIFPNNEFLFKNVSEMINFEYF